MLWVDLVVELGSGLGDELVAGAVVLAQRVATLIHDLERSRPQPGVVGM